MTRPEKYRTNLRGNLAMFESIDGTCLTPKEISYLIRVAELNSILEIPPKKASDFSKPKHFFLQHTMKNSLVFVKNGNWISAADIENEKEHFLAYSLNKANHSMSPFGYYPEECDNI